MTYIASEESVQDGDPIFRILFTQGSTEFKYTTAPIIVSTDWLPSSIKIGGITQTNEMAKDPVDISIPRDSALGLTFLGGSPDEITSVTIFREHLGDLDSEFQVYWKGRVAGTSVEDDAVLLNCENIFTSLRRSGLRARYQKNCRHALYSDQCGVSLASFGNAATATAVNGFVVTSTVASGFADGYFAGGILEDANGSKRHIQGHTGSELLLMRPLGVLTQDVIDNGSAPIIIYPGCAHNTSACKDKFSNLLNYGGQPYIPGEGNNPFASKITGGIA